MNQAATYDNKNRLFDGHDALFKREVQSADRYGEYGLGASTLWVLENTKAQIKAVDTSLQWVNDITRQGQMSPRLSASWVDVGPLGNWGMPLGYSKRNHFAEYVETPWRAFSPDVVLVDGRFRVCCFLHSLLTGKPGTRILFDDYVDRPWYHVVEEFVGRNEVCGRQALFVVPETLDRRAISMARNHFLFVRD